MNKLIKHIILELEEESSFNNDFFKPKGIEQRKQKQIEERKEFLIKIESGLKNIKIAYQNKDWDSEPERLFLEIFSKFHLDKEYDENWKGYFLLDGNNERRVYWELESHIVWLSRDYIWKIFEKLFKWDYRETQSFIKNMLNEHSKLGSFTPVLIGK
jgi:hypothetical protein